MPEAGSGHPGYVAARVRRRCVRRLRGPRRAPRRRFVLPAWVAGADPAPTCL